MPSILIICTANQCRSPVAEALLRRQLSEHDNHTPWIVESAGTWAVGARPAHAQMCKVAEEAGLDLSRHRARNVEDLTLNNYALILTMEQNHKEALQVEFPQIADRVYQLTEMVGMKYDIADPIGGGTDDFRRTLQELKRLIAFGLPRIATLASAQLPPTTSDVHNSSAAPRLL
jgi:protein-tyrosine phosphatase